jgi:ABC-type bacteriocin/lantibiotic exporter with double-glycine peptidase domain
MKSRARLIVPEVVQSSNLDCGPAALKCMLEGFGVHVHYGRLREACQTDVDGTSVDTLEEVANQLGLEAEQIMLPPDHVLLDEARALPAIAVVVLPNGMTHFVIVWRRHGPFVQLMDPATGRRWIRGSRFLSDLYVHRMPVSASDWREYAGTESFLGPLRRRMRNLGIAEPARSLIASAIASSGWRRMAALDAGVRMLDSIVRSKAIRPGAQAARVLESFLENDETIPEHYWSVRLAPTPANGEEQLFLRGAVLVRAHGLSETTEQRRGPSSPELIAALRQPSTRPGLELLRLLREDGLFTPAAITAALALASGAVILEAMLFRSLLDLAGMLSFRGLRMGAITALIVFSMALLLLEIPLTGSLLRLGRRLEVRLRLAFLRKIPRLGDRYFQSRLKSDMAERSHGIHLIRRLPELGGQLLRYGFEIVFTTAGIIWLDPPSATIAILAALAAVSIPILSEPLLMERDLRVRTHAGALTHFYLDALLGLAAIHSHGAQRAVRREHESLLSEWARAGLNLQRAVIGLETLQFLAGFGLAIWLLASHLARTGEIGAVLLLVYWALNLPALGQEVALIAWQYPSYRNITLRLLEPLGALERIGPPSVGVLEPGSGAAALAFDDVSVIVSGHSVLRDINLVIEAGTHVAIVGPSGAGKSSLVGLLLGWYRPATGRVLVDGLELDEKLVEALRPRMAWVDPAVQLWNRPLLENLQYGMPDGAPAAVDGVIDTTGLRRVIERLPEGLKTPLGEGGGLVSGGEGQRVRFARALLRPGVRLVILDEPFRGLDSTERHRLLEGARETWRDATLVWISHDIDETMGFDRVLVLEEGRVVEDGNPRELIENPDSRLHAMHQAESAVHDGLWSSADWRRVRLEDGVLIEP